MGKVVLALCLVLLIAAAEGRNRGSKLGSSRRSRMSPMWGRQQSGYQQQGYQQQGYQQQGHQQQGYQQSGYRQPTYQHSAYREQTSPNNGYQTGANTGNDYTSGGNNGYPSSSGQAPPSSGGAVAGKVDPSQCSAPGFYPTPGSCINFYRCVDFTGLGMHFTVFQFNCPAGTIFDDELDTCNHIAWTIPKRPECADMENAGLFPVSNSTAGTGSQGTGSPGSVSPGGVYPQPGGGDQGGSNTIPTATTSTTEAVQGGAGTVQGSAGTDNKPIVFQCRQDDLYTAHPVYCNRYYKCVFDGSDWSFPILTCPVELVFSEPMQKCVSQAAQGCAGKMADQPDAIVVTQPTEGTTVVDASTTDAGTVVDGSTAAPETASTIQATTPEAAASTEAAATEVATTEAASTAGMETTTTAATTTITDPTAEGGFDCPSTGYFPFETDCVRFYKCVELESSTSLKGIVFKCPDNYGFSEELSRCEKLERMPDCDRLPNPALERFSAPAKQLTVDDLLWFFNN